jgi:(3,5-dihydroxyphenyl)acetyl-CoA 1,2-dioxygenase
VTAIGVPADVLERAGLPAAEAKAWAATATEQVASFEADAASTSWFLTRGQQLQALISDRDSGGRPPAQQAAWDAITTATDRARDAFLSAHAGALYEVLTGNRARSVRLEELLTGAAARVPGLVPTAAELAAERERKLPDKEGIEFAQGLFTGHLLAMPETGRHLVDAMLRPTELALERIGELRANGTIDLGPVRVTRHGRVGLLELSNPPYLNAEDDLTLGPTEAAVDMILLDPEIEVAVFRGGVVDHPRYQGVRVFGSGVNLTRLYHGQIDFLFFLVRDLGYVNKIYRGISGPAAETAGFVVPPRRGNVPRIEKLWVAAVERLAVGGACQLLHVVDHVIATRGSRLFLPARNEGIIPGASNLRLPRFVGDRAARQAILSGREWVAGEPDAALLVDEVVEPAGVDAAVAARVAALTSSGLVNAAANRAALRAGQEPVDAFREYMAEFSVEQARCHLSAALVRNLEVHWNARSRSA